MSAAHAVNAVQAGSLVRTRAKVANRVSARTTFHQAAALSRSSTRLSSSKRYNVCRVRGSVRVRASAESDDRPAMCDITGASNSCTSFVAETKLPTMSGSYRVRAYRHWVNNLAPSEPLAIMCGDVEGMSEVPVRVHDACFTSEVLGSLKCDCADQLQYALDYIRDNGPGIVIYLQQEGRGIGLANKIAAYHLQESGLDTVDANRALNLPDDTREYSAVANMLVDLDVKSIKLMTNNPRKIRGLEALGVEIVERIPVEMEAQEHSEGYLKAKGERMDHIFLAKTGIVENEVDV